MRIIFCNIAWMKKYAGVTENDKPIKVEDYIFHEENNHECYNFEDYNGYCYGFVNLIDDLPIEQFFANESKDKTYVDGVLVIWLASDYNNEKKIVGWYKNARLFRRVQKDESFTDPNHSLCYLFKAMAADSFLLPENSREFSIGDISELNSEFAKNTLAPRVLEFIENYGGHFENDVYSEEIMGQTLHNYVIDYHRLLNEGIKHYKKGEPLEGLIFFNTARMLNETTEVLLHIADGLMHFKRFNKACEIYEQVLEAEGDSLDLIEVMVYLSDYIRDRERTLYYCEALLSFLEQEKEDVEYKIYIHLIMFKIYLQQKSEVGALKIIKAIASLLCQGSDRGLVEELKHMADEVFNKS